jgi:hypothetical protein
MLTIEYDAHNMADMRMPIIDPSMRLSAMFVIRESLPIAKLLIQLGSVFSGLLARGPPAAPEWGETQPAVQASAEGRTDKAVKDQASRSERPNSTSPNTR